MATAVNGLGVFGDEVYTSTDLQRRAGNVLDHARLKPVTISRNNEQFALLRREQAAKLVQAANAVAVVVEALSAVNVLMNGSEPSTSMSWLKVYEKDDLHRFCGELLESARNASAGLAKWDAVEATIYEWRESAAVVASGAIDSAMFEDDSDETPLPHPSVIHFEENEADGACSEK